MTNEQLVEKICRIAKARGLMPYRGYSGRMMFGATCIGFYGDHGPCMAAAEFIKQKTGLSYRYDNLALDTICYFPGVEDVEPR